MLIKGVIDLQLLYTMVNFDRIGLPKTNPTYNYYYSKFSDYQDVGRIIPLTKIFQKCEENYETAQTVMQISTPEGFEFYNDTATSVFLMIEKQGLRIIYKEFLEMFKPQNSVFSIEDNIVYTYYNLYNNTSRPTNAFNSINFTAIPKAPEFRKTIIPQNDIFVTYDYDGYHLRLLCEQVGYKLTGESAHKQLAKLYFRKDEISDEQYQEAKQINFHAIYGKIPPEYAFLEVFEKIQIYIDRLWKQFNEQGYIEDPISGKQFTGKLCNLNPAKLLNYLIQSLETSRNVLILRELLIYLKDKESKICLYVYDAITVDFSEKDGKEILEEIQRIMESGGKYPVKWKHGKSLDF